MHIWSPGGHAEEQSGNTSQERRLAGFVVAVDNVIVWICWRKLNFAIDKVSEPNEIDAIDSHKASEDKAALAAVLQLLQWPYSR